jgi:hypothetical protein
MKNQLFYLTLTKVLLPLQTETKKFFFLRQSVESYATKQTTKGKPRSIRKK